MNEREEWIEYLSGPDSEIGISRRDAELRLVDPDCGCWAQRGVLAWRMRRQLGSTARP